MANSLDAATQPTLGLVEFKNIHADVAGVAAFRQPADGQSHVKAGTSTCASPLIRPFRSTEDEDGSIFHLPSNLLTDPNNPLPHTSNVQPAHLQDHVDLSHVYTPLTPVKLNPLATAFTPFTLMTSMKPTTPATVIPSMGRSPMAPSRPARISVKSIINNLLSAKAGKDPRYATVTMAFVRRCCGPAQEEHLDTNESGRVVLRKDSQLRLRGVALGLPREFVEWLCGQGGETLTIHVSILFERKCALIRQ